MITIDEVIQKAKLVGIDVSNSRSSEVWATDLLEFAKQFVIKERELCAQVCEKLISGDGICADDSVWIHDCAAAIRSRSSEH